MHFVPQTFSKICSQNIFLIFPIAFLADGRPCTFDNRLLQIKTTWCHCFFLSSKLFQNTFSTYLSIVSLHFFIFCQNNLKPFFRYINFSRKSHSNYAKASSFSQKFSFNLFQNFPKRIQVIIATGIGLKPLLIAKDKKADMTWRQ